MKVWTIPEEASAVQWHPLMGVLPGTEGYGCASCGMRPCVSAAHHEPIAHPHHLMLSTLRGSVAVFSGDWVISYKDGRRDRASSQEFAQRFSETPFIRLSENPFVSSSASVTMSPIGNAVQMEQEDVCYDDANS